MSMYTELLVAALGRDSEAQPADGERSAIDEALRCRRKLQKGTPTDVDPDPDPEAVPVVLALQVGYDVALLNLANAVGIASGPHMFVQPQRERARLENALRDHGIDLEEDHPVDADGPGLDRT